MKNAQIPARPALLTVQDRTELRKLIERTDSFAYAFKRYNAFIERIEMDELNEFIAPIPFQLISPNSCGDLTDINAFTQTWAELVTMKAKVALDIDDFNNRMSGFFAMVCTGNDLVKAEQDLGTESANECPQVLLMVIRTADGAREYVKCSYGLDDKTMPCYYNDAHGEGDDLFEFDFPMIIEDVNGPEQKDYTVLLNVTIKAVGQEEAEDKANDLQVYESIRKGGNEAKYDVYEVHEKNC